MVAAITLLDLAVRRVVVPNGPFEEAVEVLALRARVALPASVELAADQPAGAPQWHRAGLDLGARLDLSAGSTPARRMS